MGANGLRNAVSKAGETKIWRFLWVVIGIVSMSTMLAGCGSEGDPSAGTENSVTVFADNFDGNSIDPAKWTAGGNTVSATSGVMKVETTVTDAGGSLQSQWITIDPGKTITITRKVNVHPGPYFNGTRNQIEFDGSFRIQLDQAPAFDFGVYYGNNDYTNASLGLTGNYGFYLTRNGAHPDSISTLSNVSQPIIPVWDTWFDEKLVYTPTTGRFDYFINDVNQASYLVGNLPILSSYRIRLMADAWGWYTGHYHYMDDVVVTQSDPAAVHNPAPIANGGRWQQDGSMISLTKDSTGVYAGVIRNSDAYLNKFDVLGYKQKIGSSYDYPLLTSPLTDFPVKIAGSTGYIFALCSRVDPNYQVGAGRDYLEGEILLEKINAVTGAKTERSIIPRGSVRGFDIDENGTLYMVYYEIANGYLASYIASLDQNGNIINKTGFSPPNDYFVLRAGNDGIYLGGIIYDVNSISRMNIVKYAKDLSATIWDLQITPFSRSSYSDFLYFDSFVLFPKDNSLYVSGQLDGGSQTDFRGALLRIDMTTGNAVWAYDGTSQRYISLVSDGNDVYGVNAESKATIKINRQTGGADGVLPMDKFGSLSEIFDGTLFLADGFESLYLYSVVSGTRIF